MADAGYNNKKRKVWEEDQVQHQEEEKQGRERSFRQGTEVEYRNVRGIYSSIKEIEAAAAKGYTPALYILSETWMEHAEQPENQGLHTHRVRQGQKTEAARKG